MQKYVQVPIEEAELNDLRAFAVGTLGLELAPSCNTETVIAKIRAAWPQPFIMLADNSPDTPADTDGPKRELVHPNPPELQSLAPPVNKKQRPNLPYAEEVKDDTVRPKEGNVRVKIMRQDGPGGADPVPVGVNGKVMYIERDKLSDIPYPYYAALTLAVMKIYDPAYDAQGNLNGYNPVPRLVPQYPYQCLSYHDELETAERKWVPEAFQEPTTAAA